MSLANGNAADVRATGNGRSTVSAGYLLRVHRCEDGFTATLRGVDAGPLATGIAATAREAMVAAVADARIPDAPGPPIDRRSVAEYDPPTL
jgi:hypothetical protein